MDLRINLKNIQDIPIFFSYIWYYIKRGVREFIVYSDSPTHNEIENVRQIIMSLENMKANNIQVKFINFPFCIFKDTKIVNKYFINSKFLNRRQTNKKTWECLRCDYFMYCIYSWELVNIKRAFWIKKVKKHEIYDMVNDFLSFFIQLWINKDDVVFHFPFDFFSEANEFSNKLLFYIYISINFRWWKYNHIFNYSQDQVRDIKKKEKEIQSHFSYITNLYFRNYIFQKIFNRLLIKYNTSLYIVFHHRKFSEYIFRENNINYIIFYTSKDMLQEYLRTKIIHKKNISWMTYKYKGMDKVNDNHFMRLKYINIHNVRELKITDFSKYIVGLNDSEMNSYIPYIYNFSYFLVSWETSPNLSHCMIILRELKSLFITNVDIEVMENLHGTLDVNFATGEIKNL